MTENELQGREHWHLSAERTKNKEQHDIFLSDLAQQLYGVIIVWLGHIYLAPQVFRLCRVTISQ